MGVSYDKQVYIYIYIYIYIYAHTHTHTHTQICTYMHIEKNVINIEIDLLFLSIIHLQMKSAVAT